MANTENEGREIRVKVPENVREYKEQENEARKLKGERLLSMKQVVQALVNWASENGFEAILEATPAHLLEDTRYNSGRRKVKD